MRKAQNSKGTSGYTVLLNILHAGTLPMAIQVRTLHNSRET